jgi:hypothetical protein
MKEENDELQTHLLEIESLKAKWLPTLKLLVSKINDTFSNNFKEMAVAGEVLLDEHGTNFDKYGILIKVKFRETGELQVLSAHHQSGGVSTNAQQFRSWMLDLNCLTLNLESDFSFHIFLDILLGLVLKN